ncbi:hypothetical protein OG194_35215 [Streptomyces sp. NBC_01288]|uniref:hypothetical protein n=1 Tax=Streptomyces sp. NBC_01288 TaxID=2903814 RepID=UPI002E0D1B0D|nr:hypothetical protein OG194_35215 [Streptomyces sp. NBC_01288]
MLPHTANGDSRLSFWPRVREFAVPPSMIETATVRRHAGDWAGACAAAGVDIDLDLRSVARTHGRELAAKVRADLRRLAPDLLRWHLPRIAPDGLLRPGLTLTLARYGDEGDGVGDATGPPYLVVRTPPAWADGGQRISLALWDGTRRAADARRHPHPRPSRWFRLDLHRHLWDAGRSGELRARSGADRPEMPDPPEVSGTVPEGRHCAVDRWAAEAAILLHAEGRTTGPVTVRLGSRHRLALTLDPVEDTLHIAPAPTDRGATAPPVLPDAATWVLPDLELLRTGSIDADQLHPLVAAALVPDRPRPQPHASTRMLDRAAVAGQPHLIDCRGAQHRIGLVDGVLAPLDHDPAEIRREELLVALTGTPLPCLQAIDEAHRHPDCLTGVRERLVHGDTAGALAVVEGLLGPDAVLRGGALRDELRAAAERRLVYGLFRAGLAEPGPRSGHFFPGLPHPQKLRPRRTTGH